VRDLDDEIAFFETQRATLEAREMGKWVLVHELKVEGVFDSFEEAADQAVTRFGAGPYLIRQVVPRVVRSGSWWAAETPAFPGAYGQGRTRRAAYLNLLSAIRDLIDEYWRRLLK
jgi:hypothetical protein